MIRDVYFGFQTYIISVPDPGTKRHWIPDPNHWSVYDTVYLWIKEGDEGEGPEGLRYEDVCDLPELGEILLEVLTRHLLRAPAHEHLARHLLHLNIEQGYKAPVNVNTEQRYKAPAAPQHRAEIYKTELCTGLRTPCTAPAALEHRAEI
jgi:hypothetical protein